MRRSPLRRTVGLKRGTKGLKKSRLSPMSNKKKSFYAEYAKRRDAAPDWVRCAFTGQIVHKFQCDPHHPFGRHGIFILLFFWVLKIWHNQFHAMATQSRALGWLQPPFEGKPYDPQSRRPWNEWAEEGWSVKYKQLAS